MTIFNILGLYLISIVGTKILTVYFTKNGRLQSNLDFSDRLFGNILLAPLTFIGYLVIFIMYNVYKLLHYIKHSDKEEAEELDGCTTKIPKIYRDIDNLLNPSMLDNASSFDGVYDEFHDSKFKVRPQPKRIGESPRVVDVKVAGDTTTKDISTMVHETKVVMDYLAQMSRPTTPVPPVTQRWTPSTSVKTGNTTRTTSNAISAAYYRINSRRGH